MPVVLDTRQFVLNLVYDENTLSYVPEPYTAAGAGPSSDVNVLNFPATQPVSGTVGVSGTVTVSGTATVSNGGTFPVQATETRPGTSSVTSVASSASSVSLLASNANRRAATIYNDSSADLYVKFGATASSSSFKRVGDDSQRCVRHNDCGAQDPVGQRHRDADLSVARLDDPQGDADLVGPCRM